LGQDLDLVEDGVFRVARRVAKDRVISTVDPDARHGHKTSSRGFDGYKGHAAVDPDSEIITATTVTPGNAGDAAAAADLISDFLDNAGEQGEQGLTVYGDAAYGTGEFHDLLDEAGIASRCKSQAPTAAGGLFPKDRFDIDLGAQSATCPAGVTAPIRPARSGDGSGIAYFGQACTGCPLRAQCTTAKQGRSVSIGAHEQALADARARQADPGWISDYRATRPKVERKLGHLMRRNTAGVEPGSVGSTESMPTSASWLQRSTSPDWPSSGYGEPPTDGRWQPEQPHRRMSLAAIPAGDTTTVTSRSN
jgi:Transposase DDE domain